MAIPFQAASQVNSAGPVGLFRYKFGTADGGLHVLVVTLAATGTFDGATVGFEFKLGGEWHRTDVALTSLRKFWKIGITAAIIGESYRFVLETPGLNTRLTLTVAAERELISGGSGP